MKIIVKLFIAWITLILLIVFSIDNVFAADDVQVEVTEVRNGVYFLKGQGGNIGLSVGKDGAFMIDDQYAPMSDKIQAAVHGITAQPIKFLINTHWHGDHTGGNENFAKTGSLLVAHDNVRQRLSTDQFMEAFGAEVKASPNTALPVVTFSEEVSFHLNGNRIKAIHVPNAHTDGDAIIHFDVANVIHMGDTFFNGMYPFIDVSSGGSLDGVVEAVQTGLNLADEETIVIPGHGKLTDKAGLQRYYDVLSDINTQFKALRAAGMSDEDIQAEGITLDYDEDWGNGFIGAEKLVEILLSQPIEAKSIKKIIVPDNKDLHDHGAGQKAHIH